MPIKALFHAVISASAALFLGASAAHAQEAEPQQNSEFCEHVVDALLNPENYDFSNISGMDEGGYVPLYQNYARAAGCAL
jgi:hypothetical protein